MGQKREKTKYANIYYNIDTQKYDVKYNYKVYNAVEKKNNYKSKWVYNCSTVAEAKNALANMQIQQDKIEDKDVTLQTIFELWKTKAEAVNYSKVTIRNTEQHMNMIYQFLDKDTKLKDITEETYYELASKCRTYGYSDETLHSINATFRKLINLAFKKKLIKENILLSADNIRTTQKSEYRLITHDEFLLLDKYFKEHSFVRRGVDCYPLYRFLNSLLYYSGLRIGEALALTWNDFEEFSYYKKIDNPPVRLAGTKEPSSEHLRGFRVKITKAYVSEFSLTKSPKNFKHRTIPLYHSVERLYYITRDIYMSDSNDRIFNMQHSAVNQMYSKACKELQISEINCHDFRHTFISNCIAQNVALPVISKATGDTQETILKRYSHMFESDEVVILNAMQNL